MSLGTHRGAGWDYSQAEDEPLRSAFPAKECAEGVSMSLVRVCVLRLAPNADGSGAMAMWGTFLVRSWDGGVRGERCDVLSTRPSGGQMEANTR